jgi:C1A family cysteine protease
MNYYFNILKNYMLSFFSNYDEEEINISINIGFGWKKPKVSPPSHFKYMLYNDPPLELPSKVDLREHCVEIFDQGQLGSCTANAICSAIEFDEKKQGKDVVQKSRLFLYYNEREVEGTTAEDSGASIHDGINSVNRVGICEEKYCPYKICNFKEKPSYDAYINAKEYKAIEYGFVEKNLESMKEILASGLPFVFGIEVYSSFMKAKSGNIPMPNKETENMIGGHALLCCGYDDEKQVFIFVNSWGKSWGESGFGTIPYAYLTSDLADDFWVIKQMSE